MLYASVAMGWRPGGAMSTAVPDMAQGIYTLTVDELRYRKETSWNYEIGAKSVFFDGALKVNLALFYSKYSDYQDEYHYGLYNTLLKNAGKAEAKGAEIEVEALIADRLSISASLGIVDAKYIVYVDDQNNDFSGNKIAGVPSYTASIGARLNLPEGLYVAPEVRLKGKTYWDRANLYHEDAYATLHLRAGWTRGNWEVYAYGDNLAGKYAFTRALPISPGVYDYGVPIRPLEIGLGVNYSY
jgi:iron complex outermembrane receptor protein